MSLYLQIVFFPESDCNPVSSLLLMFIKQEAGNQLVLGTWGFLQMEAQQFQTSLMFCLVFFPYFQNLLCKCKMFLRMFVHVFFPVICVVLSHHCIICYLNTKCYSWIKDRWKHNKGKSVCFIIFVLFTSVELNLCSLDADWLQAALTDILDLNVCHSSK